MKPALNELLTQVGKGTPMGGLIRRFWIPALLSSALARDEHATRIRLLGEDLLAFRDTDGRVGVVSAICPHRGAPLYYGRNEQSGLRCVYHGWKFDIAGACVDMPTEEADSPLAASTRLNAYHARERNGVVWVYMGDAKKIPPLPAFEWNRLAPDRCHISLRIQECNWVQAMEGSIDTAHAPMLHGRIDGHGKSVISRETVMSRVKNPKMEAVDMDYGAAIASLRQVDGLCYWRVTQFLFPFYTLIPPFEDNLSGQAWVPIDDEHTLCFMFSFDPVKPLNEKIRSIYRQGYRGRESGHPSVNGLERRVGMPYEDYWPKYGRHNDFGIDWEEQRAKRFSGMPGLWVQDAAVSGLLPIVDRSCQSLGTTDTGIVRVHKRLISAAQRLRDSGELPRGATTADVFDVRAVAMNLGPGESWKDNFEQAIRTEGEVLVAEPPEE